MVGKPSNAENGLVGVHLYDSGLVLISKFGSPDDVQAVSFGGSSVGPGGGGTTGRPGAGPMGPNGPMGVPGRTGGGAPGAPSGISPGGEQITEVVENDDDLLFVPPAGGVPGMGGPSGPPGASAGNPTGSRAGGPGMGGAGIPSMPGAGGNMGGQTTSTRVLFTRWVYKRDGGQYSFIVDKFNHVVEIEAIGLHNPKVRTKKGIGFGATFGTIIKKYGAPDAYEISQSTIVMRYLVRNKVAFRLNRLGTDKPHVVTGVVVAAGKS
jgi:hypothetical protein